MDVKCGDVVKVVDIKMYKNEYGGYIGKVGRVIMVDGDDILVKFDDGSQLWLYPGEWELVRRGWF